MQVLKRGLATKALGKHAKRDPDALEISHLRRQRIKKAAAWLLILILMTLHPVLCLIDRLSLSIELLEPDQVECVSNQARFDLHVH